MPGRILTELADRLRGTWYPETISLEMCHTLFGLGILLFALLVAGVVVVWVAAFSATRSALRLYRVAERTSSEAEKVLNANEKIRRTS